MRLHRCSISALFLLLLLSFMTTATAQQVRLEPLAPVPEVSIDQSYVSPLNHIYLRSNAGMHFSTNQGQSWEKVELPNNEIPIAVHFLESGPTLMKTSNEAYLEENGQWIKLINPDTTEWQVLETFGDDVIRTISGKLYRSDRYGADLQEIILPSEEVRLLDIYTSPNFVHVITTPKQISFPSVYSALVYDNQLQFMHSVELPSYDFHDKSSYVLKDDLLITANSNTISISNDNGLSFIEGSINRIRNTGMVYDSGNLYYVTGGLRPTHFSVIQLDLTDFELGSTDTLHSFIQPISINGSDNALGLLINSDYQLGYSSLSPQVEVNFFETDIRTTAADLSKFMIKNGKYYGMTDRFIYESSDQGASWVRRGKELTLQIANYDVHNNGEIMICGSERFWINETVYLIQTDDSTIRLPEAFAEPHIYFSELSENNHLSIRNGFKDVAGYFINSIGYNLFLVGEKDKMSFPDDPYTKNDRVYLTNPQNAQRRVMSIVSTDQWLNPEHIEFSSEELPENWQLSTSTLSPDEVLYVMGRDKLCISQDLGDSYAIYDLDTLDTSQKIHLTFRPFDERLFFIQNSQIMYQSNSQYVFDSLTIIDAKLTTFSKLSFDENGFLITTASSNENNSGLYRGLPILPELTSTTDPSAISIQLFPNPASSEVIVGIDNSDWLQLQIRTPQGALLETLNIPGSQFNIDLSNYPDGILYLTFIAYDGRTNTKSLAVFRK